MKSTMSILKVIEIVTKNREDHQKIFEEALEGYRVAAIAHFNKQISLIKEGKPIPHYYSFTPPENHIADYDRALKMLQFTNAVEITLDEGEFSQLILDDWGWSKSFYASNSQYSFTAMQKNKQEDE